MKLETNIFPWRTEERAIFRCKHETGCASGKGNFPSSSVRAGESKKAEEEANFSTIYWVHTFEECRKRMAAMRQDGYKPVAAVQSVEPTRS